MLSGCGHHLSGTYVSANALGTSFDFISESEVQQNSMGLTVQGTYQVQNQQVDITMGGQTLVLTIDSDGCLDAGDLLGKFCKQNS